MNGRNLTTLSFWRIELVFPLQKSLKISTFIPPERGFSYLTIMLALCRGWQFQLYMVMTNFGNTQETSLGSKQPVGIKSWFQNFLLWILFWKPKMPRCRCWPPNSVRGELCFNQIGNTKLNQNDAKHLNEIQWIYKLTRWKHYQRHNVPSLLSLKLEYNFCS